MFRTKTVFILGAGASAEVNFPLGRELADLTSDRLNIRYANDGKLLGAGDHKIFDTLNRITGGDINCALQACWRLRDGLPFALSIDSFLDNHQSNQLLVKIGKIAIINGILVAEADSLLAPSTPGGDVSFPAEVKNSWMMKIFRMMQEGVRLEDMETLFSNVAFITFNYDRTLEHFLYHAIQMSYGIDGKSAASLIDRATILHPYGTIGNLRWQNPIDCIEYGASNFRQLEAAVPRIKTYSEQIEDEDLSERIQSTMADAEFLVFLGFAFHQQNLRLLAVPGSERKNISIKGTAYCISDDDVAEIEATIRTTMSLRGVQIELINAKCTALLDQFSRLLRGTSFAGPAD